MASAAADMQHGAPPPRQGLTTPLDVYGLAQKPVRVRLIGAVCGERYCYAGVGNVDNDWEQAC